MFQRLPHSLGNCRLLAGAGRGQSGPSPGPVVPRPDSQRPEPTLPPECPPLGPLLFPACPEHGRGVSRMAACAGLPAHTSWGGARHGAPGPRTVPAELSYLAPRPQKPPPVSPPVRKGGHDGCGALRAAGARKARLEWAPPPSQGLSPSSAPQHGSAPAGRLSPARPCQGRALLLAPWSGQRTLYWWAAWWEPASQAKLGLGGLTWLLSLGTCPMVPTWGSVPLTKRPRLHPPSSQPRGLTHAEGPGDPEAGSLGPSSCPGMNGGTPPKDPFPMVTLPPWTGVACLHGTTLRRGPVSSLWVSGGRGGGQSGCYPQREGAMGGVCGARAGVQGGREEGVPAGSAHRPPPAPSLRYPTPPPASSLSPENKQSVLEAPRGLVLGPAGPDGEGALGPAQRDLIWPPTGPEGGLSGLGATRGPVP